MNRHGTVATLLMSLVLLVSGSTLAQSPGPPTPTLTPRPSYQPLPASDPVAAVDAWLDALVARQWTQLPALTCGAERADVASFYDARLSEDPGPEAARLFIDMMKPEIVDRSVTLGAISGDTATVIIGGMLRYADAEEEARVFIRSVSGGIDPSPSPEQIDAWVTAYADYFRHFALPPEAKVVREDGGWLTCTRLQVHVDPSPEP
jgi:hypothetical protein